MSANSRLDTAKARARDASRDALEQVINPAPLERFQPTRGGQWLAAAFLPVYIIVNFALLTAFHAVLSGIFSSNAPNGSQLPVVAFFVTGLTLGAFIFSAWTWFQFVRTAAFGLFEFS